MTAVKKWDLGDILNGSDVEVLDFAKALGITGPSYRIVVDMSADSVAVAYIEMYVSKKALELLTHGPKRPEVQIVGETKRSKPKTKAVLGKRGLP